MRKTSALTAALLLASAAGPVPALAQDGDLARRLGELEQAYTELLFKDLEKQKVIEDLRRQVDGLQAGRRTAPAADAGQAHDHAHGQPQDHAQGHAHEHAGVDLFATEIGGGTARLSGVFVDAAVAAGWSSESGGTLEGLQFGDHDPDTNGFTMRSVDISLGGGFDPWFDASLTMALLIDNEGETVVELEEAFLQTQDEPGRTPELRIGQYFTEFGIANPTHIHHGQWLDQPFMLSRLFGPDGLRGQGARVAWHSAEENPLTLLAGVQNAFGETQASFLSSDEAFEELQIGGLDYVSRDVDGARDLTYNLRIGKLFDAGTAQVSAGASALFGPNASGEDGRTRIAGVDLAVRQPLAGGRTLTLQGEAVHRQYDTDRGNPAGPVEDLEDYGLYAQAVLDLGNDYALGLRGEYGTGDGESIGPFASRAEDPFRADRYRLSPMASWQFAPFARGTLQYNYDDSDALARGDAHALWLGVNFAFGAGRRTELTRTGLVHDHADD